MHKEYKRLSIEFPVDEFTHLKMACAKKGISIKDFVTQAVIKNIQEYEDEIDLKAFQEAYTEENIKKAISWDDAKKNLEWE